MKSSEIMIDKLSAAKQADSRHKHPLLSVVCESVHPSESEIMKMIQTILAVLASLCLTSRAFSGLIAQQDLNQIRPGNTTEIDLVHMFGQPDTRTVEGDGKTSLNWFKCSAAPPQSYIPIVGPWITRLDARVQQLFVSVAVNGRVERYIMSDSQDYRRMPYEGELGLAGARKSDNLKVVRRDVRTRGSKESFSGSSATSPGTLTIATPGR